MRFKPAFIGIYGLAVLWSMATVQADTTINFDNGDELTTLFAFQNFITPPRTSIVSQVLSGGVGGSGAVQILSGNASAAATYKVTSYDFSQPGTTLYCSIFFKYQAPSQSWFPIQLGFLSGPNVLFDGNANAMGVAVSSEGAGNTLFMDYGRTSVGASISGGLAPGNWYRLSGAFVNQSSGLSITASLDNFGSTGTTLVNHINTISRSMPPDGIILTDNSVWLAFEGNSTAGVSLVDNLSVVPEPGVALLCLIGGALIVRRYPGCRVKKTFRRNV